MKIKKIIYTTLILIIAAISLFLMLFFNLNSPTKINDIQNLTIEKGMTLRSTAGVLKERNFIKNSDYFILLGYILDKKVIKTGSYRIFPDSSSIDILNIVTKGQVITRKVTFPEGYNIYQMAKALEKSGICEEKAFLKYAKDRSFLKSIGINSPIAEGYLFPDTYVFAEGADPREIISHMHGKMIDIIKEIASKSSKPAYSLHKMMILASIIEKEAMIKKERKKISAVFHNRLKKGMRFDSCATVWYAIGKYEGGSLTHRDLQVDSPYNTYKKIGFPPTPIGNPGKSSIEAAFNPDSTPFLFFVSRNNGSHYFSVSLRRHNQAVNYYQKGLNNGFKDDQK